MQRKIRRQCAVVRVWRNKLPLMNTFNLVRTYGKNRLAKNTVFEPQGGVITHNRSFEYEGYKAQNLQ